MTGLQKIVVPSEKEGIHSIEQNLLPSYNIHTSFIHFAHIRSCSHLQTRDLAINHRHKLLYGRHQLSYKENNIFNKRIAAIQINSPTTNILPNAPSDDRQGKKVVLSYVDINKIKL